jgi:hypothetical protein
MNDEQREQQIKHYGHMVEQAMAAGDRHAAANWMQAEMLAIALRSPEQQARMTAAIDRAIDEGVDYFAACGSRDGQQLRSAA